MLNETEAIAKASDPNSIIDPETCSIVLGYLNGVISALALEEFELEIAAENCRAKIMAEDKIIPIKESEYKLSQEYRNWRLAKLEIQKLRGFRRVLEKKENILQFTSRQTRTSYGGESYLG